MKKIKLLWHIFKGRPLVYKTNFIGMPKWAADNNNLRVIECNFAHTE